MKMTALDRGLKANECWPAREPDSADYAGRLDTVAPCRQCEHRQRCASDQLACAAFRTYTIAKDAEFKPELWEHLARVPNHNDYYYITAKFNGRK